MADRAEASARRRRLWPRSLSFRVVAVSTLWAVVALILIATVISTLFRQVSERGFDNVLSAHLFNLIGSVGLSQDGRLTGRPNLGDLRFVRPLSGWYWSVEPVSEGVGAPLRSASMTAPIASPSPEAVPFNDEFQRNYTTTDAAGQTIEIVESEFVLAPQDEIVRFRVMGNRSELEADIAGFARRLYTYLALFGAGMVAINALAILFGLRPLGRVRQALADIRAGTAERLDGSFPAEIAPLAAETNALIDTNRRTLERARTQVGNLAHSLKTPLAVLMNEGRAIGGSRGRLVADQAAAMQKQLDHHLQRARVAAQRESLAFRTPVNAVLERMVRVVGKLHPDTRLDLSVPDEDPVFDGEREDLEEIVGNLLENAMKWSSGRVRLSARPAGGTAFEIVVEDDGPGIPEDKARDALKRGRRLDESKPGTGLGLAIVADLVEEYAGGLSLGRSPLGGLSATVRLPQPARDGAVRTRRI